MPVFLRICQNIVLAAALSLVGLTTQAHAETRKAKPLSGADIRKLISGASVRIHTPLGSFIPVDVHADGSLSGTAGNVAFYLGSKTDRGRWWISGSKLCQKWNTWFDRKSNCMTVRQIGSRLYWRDNDGDTGVATIVSRPAVAQRPKKKKKSKKFTAIAYGLGLPPTFKGHIGIPQNDLDGLSMQPRPTVSAAQHDQDTAKSTDTAKRTQAKPPQRTPALRKSTHATFRVAGVAANDMLNLRRAPSTLAPIVGTIAADATGIRRSGKCYETWCHVTYRRQSGWVSSDFLASEHKSNPTYEMQRRHLRYKVVRVSHNDVLNVRDEPSADTRIAGTIPADTHGIRITGTCRAEWCPIVHGARRGWVHRHYISPVHLSPTRFR